MSREDKVVKQVEGFFQVFALGVLRRTPGVKFDYVPGEIFSHIDAIDRVLHAAGAVSPGPVEAVERPWYMHPHQVDHLLVLSGQRKVDLYHPDHGKHTFDVNADRILMDGMMLFDGPAILRWDRHVFHRVQSDEQLGSASLNFAVRDPEFDIDTNFSIYDLNLETGAYHVIRAGHLDQPGGIAPGAIGG